MAWFKENLHIQLTTKRNNLFDISENDKETTFIVLGFDSTEEAVKRARHFIEHGFDYYDKEKRKIYFYPACRIASITMPAGSEDEVPDDIVCHG